MKRNIASWDYGNGRQTHPSCSNVRLALGGLRWRDRGRIALENLFGHAVRLVFICYHEAIRHLPDVQQAQGWRPLWTLKFKARHLVYYDNCEAIWSGNWRSSRTEDAPRVSRG